MSERAAHSKRIARNSMLLYGRLLVTMLITLYTSRLVLGALGEVDFGVYSVVAGIVIMIAFLNNSLINTTQRFLNVEMARPGRRNLSEVFSTAVISHYAIAAVVALIAETVGLWYVSTHLVIPPERMTAALIVFHCSVVTLVVKIIGSPYAAAVIAHERMKIYALFSILENALTLALVLLLVVLPHDKLALYGVLMMVVGIIVRFAYIFYCRLKFPECRFKWVINRELFVRMFSFTGWMFAGTFTGMLSTQGLDVLINQFFGPVLNASRAIAIKVQGVVQSFVDSLITAVQPQIVKSYSAGETDYMNRLVFTSSKLSFYIVLLLSLPVLLNTELLLRLWLGEVPRYTVLFTQLMLIDTLITCSNTPLSTISQAAGKVKSYQIIISISFVSIFLLTWLCFKMGKPVYYAFLVSIIVNFIALFARLIDVRRAVGLDIGNYMRRVFIPEIAVLCISVGLAFGTVRLLGDQGIWVIVSTITYLSLALGTIYFLGLDKMEKKFSKQIILKSADKDRE